MGPLTRLPVAVSITWIEARGLAPKVMYLSRSFRPCFPGVRVADPKACQCGEVLKGVIKPWECKVFGTACTPERPIDDGAPVQGQRKRLADLRYGEERFESTTVLRFTCTEPGAATFVELTRA